MGYDTLKNRFDEELMDDEEEFFSDMEVDSFEDLGEDDFEDDLEEEDSYLDDAWLYSDDDIASSISFA